MMTLEQALRAAARELAAEGIIGWGLHWDGPALPGRMVVVGPSEGCDSDQCSHHTHDPAAPTKKWVPAEGWSLLRLGVEAERNETVRTYFALLEPAPAPMANRAVRVLALDEPLGFHACLWEMPTGDEPAWVWQALIEQLPEGLTLVEG